MKYMKIIYLKMELSNKVGSDILILINIIIFLLNAVKVVK